MKRKILAMITLVCFMFTLVPVAAIAADTPVTPVEIQAAYDWYTNATGDVYEIDSIEDLAGLAKLTQGKVDGVTDAATNFTGKTVNLKTNLTFADNQYWYYNDGTIVYDYRIMNFAGAFDGANNTITGLKFNNTVVGNGANNSAYQFGFFHTIVSGGGVSNLTLQTITADLAQNNYYGSLAYQMNGNMTNCHINGITVTNSGTAGRHGGLIRSVKGGTVSGCSAKNVTIMGKSLDQSAGLISSVTSGTIKGCTVEGITMTTTGQVFQSGGFIGITFGTTKIGNTDTDNPNANDNCSATDVTISAGSSEYSGAFIGVTWESGTTISGCSIINANYSCSGKSKFGGFIGEVRAPGLTNCTATSIIMNIGNDKTDSHGANGGFVYQTNGGTVNFTNCHLYGLNMTYKGIPETSVAGFLCAAGSDAVFNNCSVSGVIDATAGSENRPVGGFLGDLGWNSASVTITNCTANVNITANGPVGGFVAQASRYTGLSGSNNLTINSSNATGNVISLSAAAGGFVAVGDRGSFTGCTANGATTGVTAGGFWGEIAPSKVTGEGNKNLTINGCTATGEVTANEGVAGGLIGYVQPDSEGHDQVTLGEDCAPATNLTGAVTNEVANHPNGEYNNKNKFEPCAYKCYGKLGGHNIGFNSIQDAIDAGATEVTLLSSATEDITVNRSIILNLGENTLDSNVTIPSEGVTLTIKGISTDNNIILPNFTKDHYIFDGWCKGIDDSWELATKVDEGWKAEASEKGNPYHTHWTHSKYTHLDYDTLHPSFEMIYGGNLPSAKTITFIPKDGDNDAKIQEITQGTYFDAEFIGLDAKITPKSDFDFQVGHYVDEIRVTVHDGSTHTITAILDVQKAVTAVIPGVQPELPAETGAYTYGNIITLTAEVTTQQAVMFALLDEETTVENNTVAFYNGSTLLGAAPVNYSDGAEMFGVAELNYDTAERGLTVGENTITAVYGGSVNLNGSSSDTITVTLRTKELIVSGLTATDREYDGTTEVTLTGGELVGVLGGDDVTATMPTVGTVESADAGENKVVSFGEIVLIGDDAAYYTLVPPTVTVTIREKEETPGESETPSTGSSNTYTGVYNYPVNIVEADNGALKADRFSAVKGETVIVIATPDNGFGTAKVIVTDGDGDTIAVTDLQNGTYSFVMPEGKVSVTAVFKDAIVLKIGDNNMNVFGKTVVNDVAPQIKGDYTMLPIRPVIEALSGDVAWDPDTQKITVKLNGNTVVMYVGEKVGYINGAATEMDVPSYIHNSRAFYQLRFVAEATGTDIHWNKDLRLVTLIPE